MNRARQWLRWQRAVTAALSLALLATAAAAQEPRAGATVTGRLVSAETGEPVDLAVVSVQGTRITALSDSTGRYRLRDVPPGPQVLIVERLGYATARVPITVPTRGTVTRDIGLAIQALEMEGLIVTATPGGRAEGELGTATVIDEEAIANQSAASLQGIMELIPGQPLQPPGVDDVQQVSLRAVPPSAPASLQLGGPSAADLASLGTIIILDGVPLSNNANLQTTGPRGELFVPSSARGGIDLRRIPATTIERVEVIRGVPSARYGDLTQGAIVVETRAGDIEPRLQARYDARLIEGSFWAGERLGPPQILSGTADLTVNRLSPGLEDDQSIRVSSQLAHRAEFGLLDDSPVAEPRATLDTRLDFFQVRADNPEDPEVEPGRASENRDAGLRLSERLQWFLGPEASFEFTGALGYTRRRSFVQSLRTRPAIPFTDRLTEGRQEGKFIQGSYLSRVDIDGDEWQLFTRMEADNSVDWLGFDHRLRTGTVLRREWNTGPGFQFDVEFPPQVTFNGVQGFDRPRPFDDVPPVSTSAFYVDDRLIRTLPGGIGLDLQAGLRLDLLHEGTTWFSGVRDAALQPRFNLQLAPFPWLRLRSGWGKTAKQPTLGQLSPAPQYFDVVNVNFFANEPDERLAVLTTFIRDPVNPDLGYSTARKAELGLEIDPAGSDVALTVTGFSDRVTGGVGIRQRPEFLLRDRFQLTDSVVGNGIPTEIIEPPFRADTIPVLIDVPANNLTLASEGVELTVSLPELRPLRTRLSVQGAWISTEFFKRGLDFGTPFSDFQLNENIPRSPFWEDAVRKGERAIIDYRIIHHQPDLGLVVTATVEHIALERERTVAGTDTLAFAGYITRAGELVRVPPARRGDPEFEDLRQPRLGTFVASERVPADWLLSVQVAKTLPRGGRLRFFAFNALDRLGRIGDRAFERRSFPFVRFGVEGSLPLDALF